MDSLSTREKVNVTDAEKIARMIEWIGGWPEHKGKVVNSQGYAVLTCLRCWEEVEGDQEGCEAWNPFERIEDAFLPLEKIPHDEITLKRDMGRPEWECWILPKDAGAYIHDTGSTPARALTEAAWQVISRLDRGSG